MRPNGVKEEKRLREIYFKFDPMYDVLNWLLSFVQEIYSVM